LLYSYSRQRVIYAVVDISIRPYRTNTTKYFFLLSLCDVRISVHLHGHTFNVEPYLNEGDKYRYTEPQSDHKKAANRSAQSQTFDSAKISANDPAFQHTFGGTTTMPAVYSLLYVCTCD